MTKPVPAATAQARANVRAVELSCECAAIARELERLVAQDRELLKRECSVHGLIARRTSQLNKEQRELTGLLDCVVS